MKGLRILRSVRVAGIWKVVTYKLICWESIGVIMKLLLVYTLNVMLNNIIYRWTLERFDIDKEKWSQRLRV